MDKSYARIDYSTCLPLIAAALMGWTIASMRKQYERYESSIDPVSQAKSSEPAVPGRTVDAPRPQIHNPLAGRLGRSVSEACRHLTAFRLPSSSRRSKQP